jgi:hypothetical protein
MAPRNIQDYHVEYMDVTRHWHSQSEKYAGADCLLTALSDGWEADETVYVENIGYLGQRTVPVYHFELTKEGDTCDMAVIDNPYIWRLVQRGGFEVRPLSERNAQQSR